MKKSLRRKLLLSGLAMGVAALSLASTTYAWFSNIDTVTTSGTGVKLSTPSSILISDDGTNFGTTVALAGAKNLEDTAKEWNAEDKKFDFYELTPETKELVSTENATEGQLPGGIVTNGAGYADDKLSTGENVYKLSEGFYFDEFWLKYEGQTGYTIKVDVTIDFDISVNNEAIEEAITLEIYQRDTNTLVQDYTFTELKTGVADSLFVTLTANEPQAYDVYIWLNGAHENVKNSNVQSALSYTIDFSFSVEGHEPEAPAQQG